MKPILSLLLIGLLTLSLTNNTPVLTGIVRNKKGNHLYGVQISTRIGHNTVSVSTDPNGHFSMSLPEGSHHLMVTHPAYDTLYLPVTIESGQPPLLNIWLEQTKETKLQQQNDEAFRGNMLQLKFDFDMDKDMTATGRIEQKLSLNTQPLANVRNVLPAYNKAINNNLPQYNNAIIIKDSLGRITHIPESEAFKPSIENQFEATSGNRVSTFSIDVDRASYAYIRRQLNDLRRPAPDGVRIEEMLNYFDYQYPEPTGEAPINLVSELQPCPWAPGHHLLMIGLQGRKMETAQLPPANFIFLIDVSGSMCTPDKLPLVKYALGLLTEQLRPQDKVAIVAYAGAAGLVLDATTGNQKDSIGRAIERLSAGGSTAGGAGIQLAYHIARKNFVEGGNNRVILCTDGDFNVGVSKEEELVQLIEKERNSGVYLTVLGFGGKNYQDKKMQELADRGNGNHAYIDNTTEARKVLVSEFGGTMFTIAKDVKLQLDFDPAQVDSFRLIGYENRMLAKEDFDNDAKDAGELGAGHTVTALYEIVTVNKTGQEPTGELASIKFRYKQPEGDSPSLLIEQSIPAVCAARQSDNFQLAAAVAEFGLLLRNSAFKGSANWSQAIELAQKSVRNDANGYRKELVELIQMASSKY